MIERSTQNRLYISQNIPSPPYDGMKELAKASGKQQVPRAKVVTVIALLPTQNVASMLCLGEGVPQHSF